MGKSVKVKITAVLSQVQIEAVLIAEKKISEVRSLPGYLAGVPTAAEIFGRDWLKLTYPGRFSDMVDFKFKLLHKNLTPLVVLFPEGSNYVSLGFDYLVHAHPVLEGKAMVVKAEVIKEDPAPAAKKVPEEVPAGKKAAPHTPHKLNAKKMCIHCCRQLSKKREGEFCEAAFQEWKDSQLSPERQKELEAASARALTNHLAGRMGG